MCMCVRMCLCLRGTRYLIDRKCRFMSMIPSNSIDGLGRETNESSSIGCADDILGLSIKVESDNTVASSLKQQVSGVQESKADPVRLFDKEISKHVRI